MKNPFYPALVLSLGLCLSALAEPPLLILSGETQANQPKATSEGFEFERLRFDESGEIAEAKTRSGSIYQSYRPGNV